MKFKGSKKNFFDFLGTKTIPSEEPTFAAVCPPRKKRRLSCGAVFLMKLSSTARALCAVILVTSCFTASRCEDHKRKPICATTAKLLAENQLHINDIPVNITIGTGRRTTDRILAFILLHFISDHLGYPAEVVTYEYTSREWVENMNCYPDRLEDCTKIPLLHVGVVETTDQFPLQKERVKSAGYLGVSIKLGWFVTTAQVEAAGSGPSPDHYRYFTFDRLSANFEVNDTDFRTALKRPGTTSNWCESTRYPKCDSSGQYIPERCRRTGVRCATLLAAFPHENYEAIISQIDELALYVKVAWVGYRLESIVHRALSVNKPMLIFDYSASSLTASSDTRTEVLFPSCNTRGGIKGCIYPSAKLRKLYWEDLKTAAPQVVKLLEKADFSAEEYLSLVTDDAAKRDDDETLQQCACSFVRDRLDSRWSQGVDVYPKIKIHAIFPTKDGSLRVASATAINRINNKYLKGVILDQDVVEGGCNRENILKQYINNTTSSETQFVGVIGPDCNRSLESLIGVAEHYKHVVFSYMVDSVIDDVTRNQNYFFRIPPDTSLLAKAYVRFIKDMRWMTFAAFTESSYQSSAYIEDIRASATANSQHLLGPYSYAHSRIREKLESMRKQTEARIIIGDFPERVAGHIMCQAFKLKMTARYGYVWLLPFWINDHSFENVNDTNCTSIEMEEAVEYSFSYRFKELAHDDFVTDFDGETVLEWKGNVTQNFTLQLDEHAGFAYDAVWALGKSLGVLFGENRTFLDKLRSLNHDTSRGAFLDLARKIRTSEFRGVSGVVKFNRTLRQPEDITLYQYRNGTWENVGTFFPNGTSSQSYSNIRWFRGTKPTDGTPTCAFQGIVDALGVSCDGAHILAISGMVVGSLVFLGGIGLGFAYRHYEKKMRALEQNQGPLFTLTEYQLPEDSVRIYRPVGEGAFGKVYFGDFVDQGKNVSKVAIKAAKDPKNANAKLELLSEAEVMKQFNHVNILRLVGVIVKPESKCLIVTEFMMYGNLKSYLQDRRHLVDKGEIGAALLTQMAVDICRGLSYLASLDYVHGDLACRNCLVHESLTIKIADFGFCKNLVDQGYYRIMRNGPMPVRWMSPELLQTGVYHKESDIWSFGIVLYEIITFGGYPYHDRNDRDVQEFIRKGGFPTLPQKISSDLEALLLRIWSLDKEDRPDAMELFESLTSDAELVHPCIEEGTVMNAESLERFSRGSNSHGSMSWASRNKVRRSDSFYGSGGNRISSMKIV